MADELESASEVTLAAVAAATSACMAENGFEYLAQPQGSGFDFVVSSKLWNLPSPADTATKGYVIDVSADRVAPEPDVDSRTEHALYGDPVGTWEVSADAPVYPGAPAGGEVYDGCLPTAQTAIIGGGDPSLAFQLTDFLYRLRAIDSETTQRVLASAGWTERETAWSDCMSSKGYAFELVSDVYGYQWPEPRPSESELLAANEDLGCRSEVQLAEYANAAYDRTLGAVLEANALDLNEMRSVLRQIVDRAVRTTTEG